jgi:hypothetical protein
VFLKHSHFGCFSHGLCSGQSVLVVYRISVMDSMNAHKKQGEN